MIKIRNLNCGLRVAMEKITYVQSAAIGIWVKAGCVDEDDTNKGISHYIEHMMFKGTESRSPRQIAADIDKIGGQINAFTSKENTCYYVKTLSSNIDQACDVLLDMMLNSKFDAVEMEKEKNVVYEEIKMVEDSPEDDVQDCMVETLFKGTPLDRLILGTPESLKQISRDDILGYLKNQYSLNNIVVAVAGNFDEDAICELFEGKLASLTSASPASVFTPSIYVPQFKNKVKDIEQTHICLGTRAVKYGEDDTFILSVLNNVIGGSMSSRLFQNIREEKGMAYSVYSFTTSYEHDGLFSICAGVAHDKIEETLHAIVDELDILKKEGITEEELETSKEQMKGSYIFSLESTSSRMVSIGKNTLMLNRNRTSEDVIRLIDSVTMDDILRISNLITDITTYSGALISRRDLDLEMLIKKAVN